MRTTDHSWYVPILGRQAILPVLTGLALGVAAVPGMARAGQASPVAGVLDLGDAPAAPAAPGNSPSRGGIRPQSVTGGFTVDTSSREASRVFYNTIYASSMGVPQGWTGNVAQGIAGSNSPLFDEAVMRRINYFRAMAGIPAAVALDAVYSAKAQKAALMMSANRQLNHFPPSTWTFYTDEGAEAARNSNLALGYTGPAAIDGLIFDTGSNNAPVGHRRWFLYPQTQLMGTGNIPGDQGYPESDATWVIDSKYGTTRPLTRDDYVAWPPPGFVPYSLVPARWSLSFPAANWSSTTVTITRDGVNIPTQIESRQSGFGENTLVWIPGDLNPNLGTATPFPAPAVDSTNVVVVGPVIINGVSRTFTYNVVLFDPVRPGPDTVVPVLTGTDSPPVAQGADYSFNTLPGADAYQWRTSTLGAYSKIEGAEDAVPAVDLSTSAGYSPILTGTAASGRNSFHLAHSAPSQQRISLPVSLLIGSGSELKFSKFLGLTSPGQTAKAQVSVDGGANWQNVWTQSGTVTGSAVIPTVVFEPVTVSLNPFAGRVAQVRFVFDYQLGQTYFPQTSAGFGFYLDNISVTGAQQLLSSSTATVVTPPFRFVPPSIGSYLLEVQPRYYGEFYGEYGPPKLVTAVAGGLGFRGISVGANATLTLEFTAPAGVTTGFVLERTSSPSGPWSAAGGTAVAKGGGVFQFTGVAATGNGGFFRVRTP